MNIAQLDRVANPRAMNNRDSDEFEAWLRTRGWTWQGIDARAYDGIDLGTALLLWTISDPVRWAETLMTEPDSGKPYEVWDYQRPSIRAWNQDSVHQCGAEVGKTREIVVILLWGSYTSFGGTLVNPSSLVGAPQQTHLNEIIGAIEMQVGANANGDAHGTLLSADWLKPKRTPHTELRIRCPNIANPKRPGIALTHFRPAGHDGEAFRSLHVTAVGIVDEAAKLVNDQQFTEFYRALKPGCPAKFYSVPTGNNATKYYAITQVAVPNLPVGAEGVRLTKWPKTLMPPPFWTPERDAKFVRQYGGRNSPGYLRNVLGEHGQVEHPVWSWDTLMPNVVDLPAFRLVRIRADHTRGELVVEVVRITLEIAEGKKYGTQHHIVDTAFDLKPYVSGVDSDRRKSWQQLLESLIDGDDRGVWFAGADLGEMNDPTEIVLSEKRGRKLVDVLRVNAYGLPYHAQRELIFGVSALFGFNVHWGVDLGNAGTAVVKDLQTLDAYADARFDECMTGFQFAGSVDCIGEEGEALTQQNSEGEESIVRVPAKHWATQCISARLQHVGYSFAYDVEALNWMANHTAREGAKHPIYDKQHDHNIDARRQQMLRVLYDSDGSTVDVFSTGTHARAA